MIQCQNCGQVNNYASNFCRFCVTKFLVNQVSDNGNNFEQSPPPRPYSWKTDEFQITDLPKQKSRQINRVQPLGSQNPFSAQMPQSPPQPLTYQKPLQQNLADNLHCPRCGSQAIKYERKVSTAGWIVFVALLVTTGIFCWIGLLIKEDVKICRVCNYKIG